MCMVVKDNVGRFDITMNYALFVGKFERFTHGYDNGQAVLQGNDVIEHCLVKITTTQVFHHKDNRAQTFKRPRFGVMLLNRLAVGRMVLQGWGH